MKIIRRVCPSCLAQVAWDRGRTWVHLAGSVVPCTVRVLTPVESIEWLPSAVDERRQDAMRAIRTGLRSHPTDPCTVTHDRDETL